MKTIFGQVFAVRIVNLISKVQFSQSGKLFYQLEKKTKQEETDMNTPKEEGEELTEAQI